MTVLSQASDRRRKFNILLVDDHPILREGFAQLINHESDLRVCGQADNVPQAMTAVEVCRPDLVIVDVSLQGADGIELIKHIKARFPRVGILVLSMYDERVYAQRAVRSGASGYVMKQAPTEQVMEAIRRVLKGKQYFSEEIETYMLERLRSGSTQELGSDLGCLTDREMEVFVSIGKGLKTRETAEGLRVSVKTVDSYRANIKEKLGLKSGIELMRRAVEWVNNNVR
jgi:DNA-binding NarL/FixJ family response regulator